MATLKVDEVELPSLTMKAIEVAEEWQVQAPGSTSMTERNEAVMTSLRLAGEGAENHRHQSRKMLAGSIGESPPAAEHV